LTAAQLRSFRRVLLRWYDAHRRDLPWRRDRDPYRVWISEVMLQQTRVAAVLDHYARFTSRFPTVQSLAAAPEASVLALWSGLGYYHRARRMHQAAKVIAREKRGEFPTTAEEWLKLPGIGRYTSAAIASIAFGEPVAVVDGNVERVLQRLFPNTGDCAQVSPKEGRTRGTREAAWQSAGSLLDGKRPGDFNQAMMELGATVCTPRAPKCLLCPLSQFCRSRGADEQLVGETRKRAELHYALARNHGAVLLVRRPADASLMAGMWELPALSDEQRNGAAPLLRLRHSITDTDYRVNVFVASYDQLQDFATDGTWFTRNRWPRLPLTGLARKILVRFGNDADLKGRSTRRRAVLASPRAGDVSN
jgi:A/G-specific adenine glycosylase